MDKTIDNKPSTIGKIWTVIIKTTDILSAEELFSFLKSLLPVEFTHGFDVFDEKKINSLILNILAFKTEEELIDLLNKKCEEKNHIPEEELSFIIKRVSEEYLISSNTLLKPINSKTPSSNSRKIARGTFCIILKDIYNITPEKISDILCCNLRSYYRYISAVNNLSSNIGFENVWKETHLSLEKEIINYKNSRNG